MTNHLHALVAVPDSRGRIALTSSLAAKGIDPIFASTVRETRNILRHEDVAVVFCGSWLGDGGFEDVLAENAKLTPSVPVVVCSPSYDSGQYMDVMSRGAFDFIAFPYSGKEIDWILNSALPRSVSRTAGAA